MKPINQNSDTTQHPNVCETAQKSTSKMYTTTYDVAVKWFDTNLVMCNHLWRIDESLIDNCTFCLLEGDEIMQTFITDCNEDQVEFLIKHFDLKFTYSNLLDCYILCVDHWGTSWEYVQVKTDLEL